MTFTYARFGKRVGAGVIDFLISGAYGVILMLIYTNLSFTDVSMTEDIIVGTAVIEIDSSNAAAVNKSNHAAQHDKVAKDISIRPSELESSELKRDAALVNKLCEQLEDDNKFVRQKAAKTLKNVKHVDAVNFLIMALEDQDFMVRVYSAEAILATAESNPEYAILNPYVNRKLAEIRNDLAAMGDYLDGV